MGQAANGQGVSEINDEAARKSLGERLREAREYLGLKQDEVAAFLKIPRTALTGIESGQRKVEAIELTRLARLYRQSVGYLAGDEEQAKDLPADVVHLARQVADLSQNDRLELAKFADYLRTRAKTGEG